MKKKVAIDCTQKFEKIFDLVVINVKGGLLTIKLANSHSQ